MSPEQVSAPRIYYSTCSLMIAASGFVGVARVVADKHWASDVILGWTLGAPSGYVVPSVLHYGFGGGRSSKLERAGVYATFPGGAGLGVTGSF